MLILILKVYAGISQTGYQISGSVTDAKGVKVEKALVILRRDSFRQMVLTSDAGTFYFRNIPSGNYQLFAAHVGFKKGLPVPLNVEGNLSSLKLFLIDSLQPNQTVRVQAHRSLMKIVGDQMVYDPSLLPGLNSDNAFEVLKKLPGFWIDAYNQIHVSGNGSVTVLINGVKQSILASQIASLLQGLPASALSSVVVTTGGSYKYDASYGTVVDIQLKKRATAGLNMTLTNGVTVNKYLSDQHQLYIAYNKGALTLNTSLNDSRTYSYYDQTGQIVYKEQNAIQDQTYNQVPIMYEGAGHSHTPAFSFIQNMNWDISKRSAFLINLAGNFSKTITTATEMRDFKYPETYKNYYNSKKASISRLLSADIVYKLKIDTLGSILTLDYGVLSGKIDPTIYFDNTRKFKAISPQPATVFMHGKNNFKGYQHIFKLDFQKQINQNWQLNLGGKYTQGSLINHARYDTLRDGQFILDTSRTNSGNYKEKLAALYIGTTYQWEKFGLRVGLRMEHTHVKVKDGQRQYDNYQPNIALNYSTKPWTSLLKLSTTLSRPPYSYLNSSKLYINDYKYRQGNMDLQPSRQYRISMENSLFDFLDLSLGYIRIEDKIMMIGRQKQYSPYVVLRPENATSVNDYYLSLSVYYRLLHAKMQGHLSAYGEVYQYILPDNLSPANISGHQKYGTLSWINSLSLTRKLKLETDLFLRSNANFYQVFQRHRWQADIGMDYSLNSHWDFALKFFDLFATYKYDYTKFYDQYMDHYLYTPSQQKLRMSIVYQLRRNNSKVNKIKAAIDAENTSRFGQ